METSDLWHLPKAVNFALDVCSLVLALLLLRVQTCHTAPCARTTIGQPQRFRSPRAVWLHRVNVSKSS